MLLTVELPEHVSDRLTRHVPEAERERFVAEAVAQALPEFTEDELEAIAAEVEGDATLDQERRDWDVCSADGLGDRF